MTKNYSIQEMRQEKEAIQKIYDVFVGELDERLRNNNGFVSMPQMEYCIEKGMKSVKLSKEQKKVVNAFFDTFVGAWNMGGREMAENIAFSVTTDLADDETRFYFM